MHTKNRNKYKQLKKDESNSNRECTFMSVVQMRCILRISIKIMLNVSGTTLSICNLIFDHFNRNYFTSFPVLFVRYFLFKL